MPNSQHSKPRTDRMVWSRIAVVALLLVVAVLFCVLISDSFEVPAVSEEGGDRATRSIRDFMKQAPTEKSVIILAASAVSLWLISRLYYLWALQKQWALRKSEYINQQSSLQPHDWISIFDIRKRAFFLRFRADVILGFIVALLASGSYLVLFVLPLILEDERSGLLDRLFHDKFGPQLQQVADGTAWSLLSGQPDSTTHGEQEDERGALPAEGVEVDRVPGVFQRLPTLSVYTLTVPRNNGLTTGSSWVRRGHVSVSPEDTGRLRGFFSADGLLGFYESHQSSLLHFTADAGANWQQVSLNLNSDEHLRRVVFARQEKAAVVVGDAGTVSLVKFKASNGTVELVSGKAQTGLPDNLLAADVNFALALSANGRDGFVAVHDDRRLFSFVADVENDTLELSEVQLNGQARDSIGDPASRRLAISASGALAVVAADRGSVTVLAKGQNDKWEVRKTVELPTSETIRAVRMSRDESVLLVVGTNGTIWSIEPAGDSGSTPAHVSLDMAAEEQVHLLFLAGGNGTNINMIFVVGNKGTVYTLQYDKQKREIVRRSSTVLKFALDETIRQAAMGPSGRIGAILGTENLFLKTSVGGEWRVASVEGLSLNRQLRGVSVHEALDRVVLRDYARNYYMQQVNGTWQLDESLLLGEGEDVAASGATGDAVIVVGERGSIRFKLPLTEPLTGKPWKEGAEVPLAPSEEPILAAIDDRGIQKLVATNTGKVLLQRRMGGEWIRTGFIDEHGRGDGDSDATGNEDGLFASVRWRDGSFRIDTTNGQVLALAALPSLADAYQWPPVAVMDELERNNLHNSHLYQEMTKFVEAYYARPVPGADERMLLSAEETNLLFSRVVTLAILFLLVHILVRSYQYVLKLSAFWDARADAMLAAETFGSHGRVPFDRLVQSFAPDALDFKPPRQVMPDFPLKRT